MIRPVTDDRFRAICDLTWRLTEIKARDIPNLCVENFALHVFEELLRASGKARPSDDDQEQVKKGVEAAFEAMVAGRLIALESQVTDPEMQGLAGDLMRSAGHPYLLWQRVRALELRLCEPRLRAIEQARSAPPTLPARIAAWLRRLRRTASAQEGR